MTDTMALICEIGCGDTPTFENSVRIDIRKTPSVTVIADARHLPFKNDVFDHVYSSHTIEHFPHREIPDVLQEWLRICIPGGTIELRCPDLRIRSLLFFIQPTIQNIKNIYGEQDYPENFHRSGFSFGILKTMLEKCGVHTIRRIADEYKGIPFIPNDLHIVGTKNNGISSIRRSK
jgi:predicted SAM-dependent methyltransferase